MSEDDIKRRFSWSGVFSSLGLGLVLCLPLYVALRSTDMPLIVSAGLTLAVGPICVGLLVNLLLGKSPLLEACLGLAVGVFAWATYETGGLVEGLLASAMMTAIGGLGMWIGFSIREASRAAGSAGPHRCLTCDAALLVTKEAGTDYCPRCNVYS